MREGIHVVAGIDPEKKWSSFCVKRDDKREGDLFRRIDPRGDYVFLHDDARFKIDHKRVGGLQVVSPIAGLTSNIFDYCLLIEKAREIHVIDSSFMFLIDLLPDFGQKLFIHRYARPQTVWRLPALRKNWNVIR